jgi:hypothetical protein
MEGKKDRVTNKEDNVNRGFVLTEVQLQARSVYLT